MATMDELKTAIHQTMQDAITPISQKLEALETENKSYKEMLESITAQNKKQEEREERKKVLELFANEIQMNPEVKFLKKMETGPDAALKAMLEAHELAGQKLSIRDAVKAAEESVKEQTISIVGKENFEKMLSDDTLNQESKDKEKKEASEPAKEEGAEPKEAKESDEEKESGEDENFEENDSISFGYDSAEENTSN